MQTELNKTERELRIKNYSPKTVKSYLYGLRGYFSFKVTNLSELDQENIRDFLLHCEQKQISPQSRNLFLNAIKFYYRSVVGINKKVEVRTAKKESKLPVCLASFSEARLLQKFQLLLSVLL